MNNETPYIFLDKRLHRLIITIHLSGNIKFGIRCYAVTSNSIIPLYNSMFFAVDNQVMLIYKLTH